MADTIVCQRPLRLSNESHFQAITRVVHEFYHGSTPKACGARVFLYRIMGGRVGNTKETIEGPHPQGYIYGSNGSMNDSGE